MSYHILVEIQQVVRGILRKIAIKENGLFTIEASLVMPIILLGTVAILIMALLIDPGKPVCISMRHLLLKG